MLPHPNLSLRFIQLDFDGLWIDMNEPSAFGTNEKHPWYFDDPTHANTTPLVCPKDKWEMPPYRTFGVMAYDDNNVWCCVACHANLQSTPHVLRAPNKCPTKPSACTLSNAVAVITNCTMCTATRRRSRPEMHSLRCCRSVPR